MRLTRLVPFVVVPFLACGALAVDGDNTLTNPSFEEDEDVLPGTPKGWKPLTQSSLPWVDINDPGAQVRTGTRSIMFPPPDGASGAFIGWSTDKFSLISGELYNPPYVYEGGDLLVSGWFNIPVGEELAPGGVGAPNDVIGIKLELRRVPPDFSIYEAFEFQLPVSATNGTWQRFDIVLEQDMVGNFPPYPGSVTILPFRFKPDEVTAQGNIYWDDFCVVQVMDSGCLGDLTTTGAAQGDPDYGQPDGTTDLSDLLYFVNIWNADLGTPSPNPGSQADVTTTGAAEGMPGFGEPDGNVDLSDLLYYVNEWNVGRVDCP